jgi:Na+/glutamate symporter
MLNFVKNAFRNFMEVILWINLLSCAIVGGVIGNSMGKSYDPWSVSSGGVGHAVLGVILGLVVGMLMNIVWGGFIAAFLSIEENIAKMEIRSDRIEDNLERLARMQENQKIGNSN